MTYKNQEYLFYLSTKSIGLLQEILNIIKQDKDGIDNIEIAINNIQYFINKVQQQQVFQLQHQQHQQQNHHHNQQQIILNSPLHTSADSIYGSATINNHYNHNYNGQSSGSLMFGSPPQTSGSSYDQSTILLSQSPSPSNSPSPPTNMNSVPMTGVGIPVKNTLKSPKARHTLPNRKLLSISSNSTPNDSINPTPRPTPSPSPLYFQSQTPPPISLNPLIQQQQQYIQTPPLYIPNQQQQMMIQPCFSPPLPLGQQQQQQQQQVYIPPHPSPHYNHIISPMVSPSLLARQYQTMTLSSPMIQRPLTTNNSNVLIPPNLNLMEQEESSPPQIYSTSSPPICWIEQSYHHHHQNNHYNNNNNHSIHQQQQQINHNNSTIQLIDWKETTIQDFIICGEIGSGSFGSVRLCIHRSTGRYFVLKIINRNRVNHFKQIEHILNERNTMFSISSPFIVKLYATYKTKQYLYFVMEYVSNGELFNYIRKEGPFNQMAARDALAEMIVGLESLHCQNIIYRDLKPENILIDHFGHIKLADFGFAKRIDEKTTSMCGTISYMGPEVMLNRGHGKSADWWSAGIVLYEMIAGYLPFELDVDSSPSNQQNLFNFINDVKEERETEYNTIQYTDNMSPHLKSLLSLLLQIDPEKRYGGSNCPIKDIKTHPFFNGINWNTIESSIGGYGPLSSLKSFTINNPIPFKAYDPSDPFFDPDVHQQQDIIDDHDNEEDYDDEEDEDDEEEIDNLKGFEGIINIKFA